MISKLVSKVFGSKHDRDVKNLQPIVDEINEYFQEFENLSDDDLKAKTEDFKNRIAEATKEVKENLDGLYKILHSDTIAQTSNGQPDEEDEI